MVERIGLGISWIGFAYLVAIDLLAFYFLFSLNLDLIQTLVYMLAVAIIAGLPYLLLAVLTRLLIGRFAWLPWRARLQR